MAGQINLRMFQKFAWRHSIYINMRLFNEVTRDHLDPDSCMRVLTFDQCADHMRHDVCDALGADTTYLSSNEE